MVYRGILMTLAIYKAAVIWNEAPGFNGSALNLIRILIRNQVIYFAGYAGFTHTLYALYKYSL